MKKGFILPIVLILMSMLMAVSVVLNKRTVDKTTALTTQQNNYYIKKEMNIFLEEEVYEVGGESPFTDVVAINDGNGRVSFINSGYIRNTTEGKLWVGQGQIDLAGNPGATCVDISGAIGNNAYCEGIEEFFPCKYKFNLPSERFSQIRGIDINSGSIPSDFTAIPPGNHEMPNLTQESSPTDLNFTGYGEYHITNFRANRRTKATFGPGRYSFDRIEFTTGYDPDGNYNLDFAKGSEVWVKDEVKLEVGTKARFQGDRIYINKLTLNNSGAEVVFGEGIYWIGEIVFGNTGNKITIPEGEKVKIYTNKITSTNSGTSINPTGKPSQLLIANYSGDVSFEMDGFNLKGFLYTDGDVSVTGTNTIQGSVISKNLELKNGATIELYSEEGVQLPTRRSIENEFEMW